MRLNPGTRLGPYEIVSPLGAGGMGEVYRARDTTLGRDVAIKILPELVASDPDRLTRFEREARTLAALNHPNIAQIFGVETDGRRALVMELVEGEDLSVLISRGPVPVAEALRIARQIVDALEAAHEAGIIHRDLKPANIKMRADGTVKLLDFGLAKGSSGPEADGSGDAMNSPTLTARATQLGMILGTAAYMAPEQAKGKTVDKRADIWAFGVVLYELLTGRRAFEGDDASTTLAAVLMREPDQGALPIGTPAPVRALISRCLEKDPRQRLRDIGDARFAFIDAAQAPSISHLAPRREATSRLLLAGLATLAVGSTAAAVWLWWSRPTSPLVHLSIALPPGHGVVSGPAISRDGRRVAFVSSDGIGRPQLFIRALDEAEARPLPGTEEAADPFFAPDGQWVAFYARNRLFKINVEGGAPVSLADSTSSAGGTWTDAGTIIFKKAWNGGLDVVGENGGTPVSLVAPQTADEYAYVWPYAIPGGREILFASWGTQFKIVRLDLSTMERRTLSGGWRRMVSVPSGHVIGASDDGELVAVGRDGSGGSGQLTTVLKGVDPGAAIGDARFDVSATGTLAYLRADRGRRSLVSVDRHGNVRRVPLAEGQYELVRAAGDAHRAAVIDDAFRLAIVDLARGVSTPLVPELDAKGGARAAPVWAPDGRQVAFASNHEGNWEIYAKPATGAGDMVTILRQPRDQYPESYAPDGTLLFSTVGSDSGSDLWLLPPGGAAMSWVATGAEEVEGRFSPDGHYVAYASNASGRFEVYVQSRAHTADRVQVSAAGGRMPVWSSRSDRLYFRQGNALMEAVLRTDGGLSTTTPVQLFNGGWSLPQWFPFDATPDGNGFLMVEQARESIPTRIDVVLNWLETLRDRLGAR